MENLADKVESDPRRKSHEKETGISFLGDEEEMRVVSAKPTIVRSLLKHDYSDLNWVEIEKEETSTTVRDIENIDENDIIYAVSVDIPIGCLTIKSSPKSNNYQSSVINTKSIDPEAFS